ncbi:MAG: alpha-amylase/4-alpha-glucanotransferase domain-containing protein, partial [bacterium]
PSGRVYLPPSSYEEMEEWSLPPLEQVELKKKKASLDQASRRFLRGGYFQNFLAKYAESNKMHKRMLFLRSQLKEDRGKACTNYLRGQCNCAYWHGVFGGLYFPFLREAIYREVLKAESILSPPEGFTLLDFDKDGLE